MRMLLTVYTALVAGRLCPDLSDSWSDTRKIILVRVYVGTKAYCKDASSALGNQV